MNKEMWFKTLEKCSKPIKCVCGREYNKSMGRQGGFVTDGVCFIWCCSKRCGQITQNKLY